MKELSIFVDESGDFGCYQKHAPYYIITMVLHDQRVDITNEIKKLDLSLERLGEYSCAMKSHFRKSGNQMSGKWKSSYASLLA